MDRAVYLYRLCFNLFGTVYTFSGTGYWQLVREGYIFASVKRVKAFTTTERKGEESILDV